MEKMEKEYKQKFVASITTFFEVGTDEIVSDYLEGTLDQKYREMTFTELREEDEELFKLAMATIVSKDFKEGKVTGRNFHYEEVERYGC
jgi:hypothetical protein